MTLRLATWPTPEEFARVPYLVAFYRSLEAVGVIPTMGLKSDAEWLRANRAEVDAVHIHWPDGLWTRGTKGSLPAQIKKALAMRRFLREARALGVKIIWTVHNFARHDGSRLFDRACYSLLARHVDLFICHSEWAAGVVAETYRPTGQIVVMPIGSFPGVYPPPRPRDVVLRELGLPDRPTVCAVGNIKIYKGLDIACDAVRRLNGDVQLVIGGRPAGKPVDVAAIRGALAERQAGTIVDRVLNPQEFSDIVGASEAVLLPYRAITGSAVLLTAWTLGRGVVASDLPYFRETAAPEPDAARLFRPGDPAEMSEAIRAYLSLPLALRSAAAGRLAEHYEWDRCTEALRPVFERWAAERGPV